MGHGHYGWAFWGCIYLLSLPMGLLAERAGRKRVTFASRRGRLLAAGLVIWCGSWPLIFRGAAARYEKVDL